MKTIKLTTLDPGFLCYRAGTFIMLQKKKKPCHISTTMKGQEKPVDCAENCGKIWSPGFLFLLLTL